MDNVYRADCISPGMPKLKHLSSGGVLSGRVDLISKRDVFSTPRMSIMDADKSAGQLLVGLCRNH